MPAPPRGFLRPCEKAAARRVRVTLSRMTAQRDSGRPGPRTHPIPARALDAAPHSIDGDACPRLTHDKIVQPRREHRQRERLRLLVAVTALGVHLRGTRGRCHAHGGSTPQPGTTLTLALSAAAMSNAAAASSTSVDTSSCAGVSGTNKVPAQAGSVVFGLLVPGLRSRVYAATHTRHGHYLVLHAAQGSDALREARRNRSLLRSPRWVPVPTRRPPARGETAAAAAQQQLTWAASNFASASPVDALRAFDAAATYSPARDSTQRDTSQPGIFQSINLSNIHLAPCS